MNPWSFFFLSYAFFTAPLFVLVDKKRRLTHRKCCKLSVFRQFLFCLYQTYSSSALLSRHRLYFCTYCHEFDSYNYPNILFQMLSTVRPIGLIEREMLVKVRKFKDFD